MSIIISQDGFTIDSGMVRPKAPLDRYEVTIQVVQRYDGDGAKAVPRPEREINVSIEHRADDTEATFDSVLPLTIESATKMRDQLTDAIALARNP